jgi:NAD(P)-dependent dehydrogenase (short-subunit alcohol dehydrogenase family)
MSEKVRDIEIDLGGTAFRLIGSGGELADALAAALAANGGRLAAEAELPDLLVVACPMLPSEVVDLALLATAREAGEAMATRGAGRILFVLSAMAGLPVRRHYEHSVAMAGMLAGMRGLAMRLAPQVLVNAVGAGAIEGGAGLVSGEEQMLDHAALGRPGTVDDVVNAALFLCDPSNSYTTGQLLNVDGGWSVGYGRNF